MQRLSPLPLCISIHAPRTGSDVHHGNNRRGNPHFNLRSPHGERRGSHKPRHHNWEISIHAPRTGSDRRDERQKPRHGISIHAPRTGSDAANRLHNAIYRHFNPRSPHGERHNLAYTLKFRKEFQSTLPARGATQNYVDTLHGVTFQSTLPARGATKRLVICQQAMCISIHAPRTGSDENLSKWFPSPSISIHAPRTGSDKSRHTATFSAQNFNPRSPHGERLESACQNENAGNISIHAPRTGSDAFPCPASRAYSNFNPRSPHGERRPCSFLVVGRFVISIHAPRTGSDTERILHVADAILFQSTLPARGAT